MTALQQDILFNHNDDNGYRAWGSAMSQLLQSGTGLVKTNDTGQVDWTTATRPTTSSQTHYEIYRFDDALQATRPVFIRVAYGTGNSTTTPTVGFRVGSGTNGAGTLTGTVSGTTDTSTTSFQASSTTPSTVRVSKGAGYFAFHAANNAGTGTSIFCALERTRNDDGSLNANGLYGVAYSGNLAICQSLHLLWAEGSVNRNWLGGTNAVFPSVAQLDGSARGLAGADTNIYAHIPYLPARQGPATVIVGAFQLDFAKATTFQASVAGRLITYMALGAMLSYAGQNFANSTNSGNSSHSAAIRWE